MKISDTSKNGIIIILSVLLLGAIVFFGLQFTDNDLITDDGVLRVPSIGGQSGIDKKPMTGMNMNRPNENRMADMNAMHMDVNSEEAFIREMIPHHQEAVVTSQQIVEYSTNKPLVALAQNIVSAQKNEIAMMEGWLKNWYAGSTGTATYQPMMGNLTGLTGKVLDTTYLQGMIMHHMGAVMMAQSVLRLNPRPEVQQLAHAIIDTQMKEIDMMKQMLGQPQSGNASMDMMGMHNKH